MTILTPAELRALDDLVEAAWRLRKQVVLDVTAHEEIARALDDLAESSNEAGAVVTAAYRRACREVDRDTRAGDYPLTARWD